MDTYEAFVVVRKEFEKLNMVESGEVSKPTLKHTHQKIEFIKLLREATGLGLLPCKKMADTIPSVISYCDCCGHIITKDNPHES